MGKKVPFFNGSSYIESDQEPQIQIISGGEAV